MDLYEALYTTRAMRRVRPDPVPYEALSRILDAAVRAPSGGNAQNWRMLGVDDPSVKERLALLYRSAYATLNDVVYAGRREEALARGDEATLRVMRSSDWLAENFEKVPLWLLFFSRNDPTGASIYPAVWSAMLAARGQGVGTCLTTILGNFEGEAACEVLGVPVDRGWQMKAAVSCGYPLGRWGVAKRRPVEEVTYWNRWDTGCPIEVIGPLWP